MNGTKASCDNSGASDIKRITYIKASGVFIGMLYVNHAGGSSGSVNQGKGIITFETQRPDHPEYHVFIPSLRTYNWCCGGYTVSCHVNTAKSQVTLAAPARQSRKRSEMQHDYRSYRRAASAVVCVSACAVRLVPLLRFGNGDLGFFFGFPSVGDVCVVVWLSEVRCAW